MHLKVEVIKTCFPILFTDEQVNYFHLLCSSHGPASMSTNRRRMENFQQEFLKHIHQENKHVNYTRRFSSIIHSNDLLCVPCRQESRKIVRLSLQLLFLYHLGTVVQYATLSFNSIHEIRLIRTLIILLGRDLQKVWKGATLTPLNEFEFSISKIP